MPNIPSKSQTNYTQNLIPTEEQLKIINIISGNTIVKAGPGCAKTSTLAMRCLHMIHNGVDPKSIVILTYSKELTLDIKSTLEKHLGEEVAAKVTVETLHSFSYKLSNNYLKTKGKEIPSVLTEQSKNEYVLDYSKNNEGLTYKELKRAFKNFESNNVGAIKKSLGSTKFALAESAYKAFTEYKIDGNTIDFPGMISKALALLKSDLSLKPTSKSGPRIKFKFALKQAILKNYQHLMLDETQDIDGVQKNLIIELSKHMKSTILVGDPQQSIFEWRKSLPRYWQDLVTDLNAQELELTESFRIPKQALALVNNIRDGIDKTSKHLVSNVEGEVPELKKFADQDAQHKWLSKEIRKLLANKVKLSAIAILGKTKKELSQTKIAIRAVDIIIDERYAPTGIDEHIKHLLALIQLTVLWQQMTKRSQTQITNPQLNLAKQYIDDLWLSTDLKERLKTRLQNHQALLSVESINENYNLINKLSNAIVCAATLSKVESAVQCLIDASKSTIKKCNIEYSKLLIRDLSDIKIKARHYTSLNDIDCMVLYNTISFNQDHSSGDNEEIKMMTVHSAKGGEWNYVFLINVVKGVYPSYLSKKKDKILEMKVFYVAITRHHKKLYLMQTPIPIKADPKSNTLNYISNEPSPFINISKQGLSCKVSGKIVATKL